MTKRKKSGKKYRAGFIAVASSILVGFVIIIIGMHYYNYRVADLGFTDTKNYKEYQYHYAIISEEADVPFWEDLYEGALEAGEEQNIYVEKIGSNLSADYSLQDLMKIAIASKVNGIIVEPNKEGIADLIDEADAAGIPVITVIKDAPDTKRKSFIGINSYNLGQAYGEQVLELARVGSHRITVLMNSDHVNTSQAVIYSSIVKALGNCNAEITSTVINTPNTFSREEEIRKIIMNTDSAPDILVCLNASDTLSAYQAIVDYNKVGKIDIIGYYYSNIIIKAIEKNIIYSTMTFDAKQMGIYCIEALSEYNRTKHASAYYSVDICIINAKNAAKYGVENTE
jgi:ribose transport system substrate-binding protein